MSCSTSVQTFRSSGVNGWFDDIEPLLAPRLITSVVSPSLSYSPRVTSLPPITPIEPVSVPGAAKIFFAPMAM